MADNLTLVDQASGSAMPMMEPGFLPAPRPIDLPEFIARNISTPDAPRTNYGFLKPLMRRGFLAQHGLRYDEQVRFAEDFALYVDCLRAGAHWWLHPEPMYRYLVRPDSLTQVQTTGDLDRLRRRQRQFLAEARRTHDHRFAALAAPPSAQCRPLLLLSRLHRRAEGQAALGRAWLSRRRTDSVPLVVQEGVRQLPIVLRKAMRGGYQRSATVPR